MTIQYYYDPLCGWCYGFSPVIKRLQAHFGDDFQFEIFSGGMVLGEREGPIGKMAAYLEQAYPRVEQTTGIKFGEAFLEDILREGSYRASSLIPCIALTVFKTYRPESAIAFAHDLQKAFYYEGKPLNEPTTYQPLAEKYGLEVIPFIQQIGSAEAQRATQMEFARVAEMGISGYPSLIYQGPEGYRMLAQGYRSYEDLAKVLSFIQKGGLKEEPS
jgi:putative protein-disulfide isomerase